MTARGPPEVHRCLPDRWVLQESRGTGGEAYTEFWGRRLLFADYAP